MDKFYVLREMKSGLYVSQFYCNSVWTWAENKDHALIIRGEDNAYRAALNVNRIEARWQPFGMFGSHNPPQMEYVSA